MTAQVKLIEIRDEGTFIPAMAIKFDSQTEHERWFLSRAGYGKEILVQQEYVLLATIDGARMEIQHDPYEWKHGRTMPNAHKWLLDNWHLIRSGDVLDVQFFLGETATSKVSERVTTQQSTESAL